MSRALRARLALAPLAAVTLTSGVVRVIDSKHGFDTVFDDVQGRLDGLELTSPLSANLSAVWRETPITASVSLDSFDPAGRHASALAIAMLSNVGKFAFTGSLSGGAAPGLAGELSFSSPAMTALARLVGAALPAYFAADDVAFASKFSSGPDGVTLNDATIGIAGQTLDGALRISRYLGRTVVSGTLDAERLSAGALFGAPAPWLAPDGGLADGRFAASPPTTFDVDLRLSAGALDVYGHTFGNAAASVLLKGGELTATLIEATAYAGKIEGEARLKRQEGDLDLHARATLSEADLGAALADFGWPGFSGQGAVDLGVATLGASPKAAVAHLSGTGSLRAKDGVLPDLNIEEGLRRSQRRPLDEQRDLRPGQTPFDQIDLEILIGDGITHVARANLAAQGLEANLSGSVDLASRELNLRVEAVQTSSADASAPARRFALDIAGPWAAPEIRALSTAPQSDGSASPQP